MSVPAVSGVNRAPWAAGRIPQLDGLRGVAILLVLIYHCAAYEPERHSLGWYLMLPRELMWSGVDLFFVLSGFLIGGILMDNREANRYFQAFYARRIFRIFPLYYGLLGLVGVCIWAWPNSTLFASRIPLWVYALFAQNIVCAWVVVLGSAWTGATWSLAVEEQFYLVLPVLVRNLRREWVTAFALGCVVGAPLLRIILISRGAVFTQVYPLIFCRADALAYGVLAAVVVRSERARGWVERHTNLTYAACGLMLAAASTTYKWSNFNWVATAGYSFVDALYFLVLLCLLIIQPPWMIRALKTRPLIWLGAISYGAYLFHGPVLGTLFEIVFKQKPFIRDAATLMLTLAGLAITLLLAQASWRWFERPLVAHAHARYKYQR